MPKPYTNPIPIKLFLEIFPIILIPICCPKVVGFPIGINP